MRTSPPAAIVHLVAGPEPPERPGSGDVEKVEDVVPGDPEGLPDADLPQPGDQIPRDRVVGAQRAFLQPAR